MSKKRNANDGQVRVLLIDIETSPIISKTWGVWQQNVGENQVVEDSYMMCFAAKWLGTDEPMIYHEQRGKNDKKLVKKAIKLLDEADFVIAHNIPFDIPKINAYALLNDLNPPSPYKYIDTLMIARKNFKLQRNTLSYLTSKLTKTQKLKHKEFFGMELWNGCQDGNDAAWEEMKLYNIADVVALEELYNVLKPWMKNHPHLFVDKVKDTDAHVCPRCGGIHHQKRGFVTTMSGKSKAQRYRCKDCKGWSRGKYELISKDSRLRLAASI